MSFPKGENKMKLDWRESFINYEKSDYFYIYTDINASYCSIHQYLENGRGKPCVVANGNASGLGNSGACLAISYEARAKGIQRGCSLRRAKNMVKNLTVYESCLPLYEVYADLFDTILECIIPSSMFYRGSCDEVVIKFDTKKIYIRKFSVMIRATSDFLKHEFGLKLELKIKPDQIDVIEKAPILSQSIYAICYLVRDCMEQFLGIPLSVGVAPSISLAKSLIEFSKPKLVGGRRVYRTFHDAICFPETAKDANGLFREMSLADLCGIREIAFRLKEQVGIVRVGQFQDYMSLERSIKITRNLHLGRVCWYMCHGRDDVLSGYLAAIRDEK